MTVDTHAQNLLSELKAGKEINWDYIPTLVKQGKISRQDAISSLTDCLVKVLPKYQKFAQTGDAQYWGQRLSEAERALASIRQNQTVTYRTIPL